MKKKIPKYSELLKKGIPAVLIPGIIFAAIYGTGIGGKIKNYYQEKRLFPDNGVVIDIEDGDTFSLKSGQKVRMLGVNAPARGKEGYEQSKEWLSRNLSNEKVFLEYDRYQNDKYGRILAWVWIDCESKPKFLEADYMHLSGNESRDYVSDKPEGCKAGKLINQEIFKNGLAETVEYAGRGRLKYELEN